MSYPDDPQKYHEPGFDQRRPAPQPTAFAALHPPAARRRMLVTPSSAIGLLGLAGRSLGFAPYTKLGCTRLSRGPGAR